MPPPPSLLSLPVKPYIVVVSHEIHHIAGVVGQLTHGAALYKLDQSAVDRDAIFGDSKDDVDFFLCDRVGELTYRRVVLWVATETQINNK